MCIWGCGWWHDLGPQVKSALLTSSISGAFTLVAAAVGFGVVVLQLRGQGKNARQSNEHIERIKLKKDTYETIARDCSEVLAATSEARTFMWNFISEYAFVSRGSAERTLKYIEEKRPSIGSLSEIAIRKAHDIGILVKRWRIIDARIVIFETAMESILFEVAAFIDEVQRLPAAGNIEPKDFVLAVRGLDERFGIAERYILDLETEMQNTLLGDLFEKRLPSRVSDGAHDMVISLDKFDELLRYFEFETEWGKALQARKEGGNSMGVVKKEARTK
jgi:hypothetical protein